MLAQNYAVSSYTVSPLADNEALERLPDIEQAEMSARNVPSVEPSALVSKDSLPDDMGQNINLLV